MTIRFPSGLAITYNDAMWFEHPAGSTWILRTRENGRAIAFIQASAGALVEWAKPCMVKRDDRPEIDQIIGGLKSMTARDLQRLKAAIRPFNATRQTWTLKAKARARVKK